MKWCGDRSVGRRWRGPHDGRPRERAVV